MTFIGPKTGERAQWSASFVIGPKTGDVLELTISSAKPADAGAAEGYSAKPRQVQALRTRVAVLRQTMNAARLDYFASLLELRTLQGNANACERIQTQIRNLVQSERPKRARKAKE